MMTLAYVATLIVVILILLGVIYLYCAIKQRDRQIRNLINDVCVYKTLYKEYKFKLGNYLAREEEKFPFSRNCEKCGKFLNPKHAIAVRITPDHWEHYHYDCFPIKYKL